MAVHQLPDAGLEIQRLKHATLMLYSAEGRTIMETMTPEQAAEAAKGLTFEKVWLAMMESRRETDRAIAESRKETDRILAESRKEMAESRKETDRILAESRKEMAESRKETDRLLENLTKNVDNLSQNIGGVNNTIGRLTEAFFSPDIEAKFNSLGYEFTTAGKNMKFSENGQRVAEADILLENGKYVMIVEVKTELDESDVDKHVKRVERIRQHMDKRKDKRKLLGAVATAVEDKAAIKTAEDEGFFVLVLSGDSVRIATENNFTPREW
jgi:hypothetical protein